MKNKDFELMLKSIKLNNLGIGSDILKAFSVCDRKYFVKNGSPYIDVPQHVAHGQTISQPSTIARMIRLLKLEKDFDVLEIGANTGYHASIVAYLVYPGNVFTIEIFPDLAKDARKNVERLKKNLDKKEAKKFSKIKIVAGDALNSKNEIWKNKYDRIYFTAGVGADKINDVRDMTKALLKENGIVLFPTREAWDYGALEIWKLEKKILRKVYREEGYAFVPLLRKQELEEFYSK